MTILAEWGVDVQALATQPTDMAELSAIVTRGSPVDPILASEIKQVALDIEHRQFNSGTMGQAKSYIEIAGLNFDEEALLVNYYGVLVERRFPVPEGLEDNAGVVKRLGDQQLFAFALLLTGKREKFDAFTHRYPHMFGPQQ